MNSRSRWNRFPPSSRPIEVEDGLKARSRRGAIAQSWWSARFIAVLESMGIGGRMQRGRTYARKGQVVSLELDPGLVTARVQGSRSRPYAVSIELDTFDDGEWDRVETALVGNAWYLAKLLAGEMPEDIEDLFDGLGLPLFPTTLGELTLDCSCPDYAVPCKHLAAVFYLLAESFDEDPFRILAWRGREREDLLDDLDAARSGDGETDAAGPEDQTGTPLEDCLGGFFSLQGELPTTRGHLTSPGALLDQLPPVGITVREQSLVELLGPAYAALSETEA